MSFYFVDGDIGQPVFMCPNCTQGIKADCPFCIMPKTKINVPIPQFRFWRNMGLLVSVGFFAMLALATGATAIVYKHYGLWVSGAASACLAGMSFSYIYVDLRFFMQFHPKISTLMLLRWGGSGVLAYLALLLCLSIWR